jgi:formylglycine-generating enzyme required for sulfatase activity
MKKLVIATALLFAMSATVEAQNYKVLKIFKGGLIDYIEFTMHIDSVVFDDPIALSQLDQFPIPDVSKFEMVLVEQGTFIMGCLPGRDDKDGQSCGSYETYHTVNLTKDFYIGKYEVTQGLW